MMLMFLGLLVCFRVVGALRVGGAVGRVFCPLFSRARALKS